MIERTSIQASQGPIIDFAESALDSFRYSLLQAPATGVTQIIDRFGTDPERTTRHYQAPRLDENSSRAQQIGTFVGGTIGSALPMILLYRLAGPGAAAQARSFQGAMARSMLTGFLYDSILTPVEHNPDVNFWYQRGVNGLTGAFTFGAMTAPARALHASRSAFWRHDIVSGAISGIPAGFVSSDVRSFLTTGQRAGDMERLHAIGTMFLGGALMGATNRVHEHFFPRANPVPGREPGDSTTIGGGRTGTDTAGSTATISTVVRSVTQAGQAQEVVTGAATRAVGGNNSLGRTLGGGDLELPGGRISRPEVGRELPDIPQPLDRAQAQPHDFGVVPGRRVVFDGADWMVSSTRDGIVLDRLSARRLSPEQQRSVMNMAEAAPGAELWYRRGPREYERLLVDLINVDGSIRVCRETGQNRRVELTPLLEQNPQLRPRLSHEAISKILNRQQGSA